MFLAFLQSCRILSPARSFPYAIDGDLLVTDTEEETASSVKGIPSLRDERRPCIPPKRSSQKQKSSIIKPTIMCLTNSPPSATDKPDAGSLQIVPKDSVETLRSRGSPDRSHVDNSPQNSPLGLRTKARTNNLRNLVIDTDVKDREELPEQNEKRPLSPFNRGGLLRSPFSKLRMRKSMEKNSENNMEQDETPRAQSSLSNRSAGLRSIFMERLKKKRNSAA